MRRTLPDGATEPGQVHHAWADDVLMDDLILLNLPQHSDHPMHPQTPYPSAARTAGTTRRAAVGYQVGLVGFVRLNCLLRQIPRLRFVHPGRAHRLVLLAATSIAMLPLRWWQSARFGRRIAAVRLTQPPVFIIGHWRSGTTHLHNLMSQDPDLACVTMYQALVPDASLVGGRWLEALLARIVPLSRPMDNMSWPMDAPQEDEVALAKMIPHSFYAQFVFPSQAEALFDRYVLLDGASPAMVAELERNYRRLLQIATLNSGGKRLVLKNPVNTARLPLLLRLFPDAKFVHIHRSPYEVYPSTVHLHDRLQQVLSLEKAGAVDNRAGALAIYEKLMRRYLADKALVPPGNLIEVRYADLVRDPEAEVKRIYDQLALPGHETLAPALRAYLASVHAFHKNEFALTAAEHRLVTERCGFAFDALGYARAREEPAS